MPGFIQHMSFSIWFQTKFTSICNGISATSLHTPEYRQNLHQPAATDLSRLTYPRVQTKIYMNMQHYLSYKPTYPRVQTNFTSLCNSISATSLHTQSAGKIYMNMQQYLSYKPTYPRVQTNFTSICNSISTTRLHTQSAGKIYVNMQHYLSYKPTYRQTLYQYAATVSQLQAYIPCICIVQIPSILSPLWQKILHETSSPNVWLRLWAHKLLKYTHIYNK